MKHIIFLNGPPGSGKDAAGALIEAATPWAVVRYKAATPIKAAIGALLGLSKVEQEEFKTCSVTGIPSCPLVADILLRQLYIDFSEAFAKPRLGQDVFGILLAHQILKDDPPIAVVTDCGFLPELVAAVKLLRPAGYHPHVWQLHRKGHTFAGDSRSYLNVLDLIPLDIHEVTNIQNNGSLDELRDRVLSAFWAIQPEKIR